MNHRFDRNTKLDEVRDLLEAHGVYHYDNFIIGMIVLNCKYVEIVGYGSKAELKMVRESETE